MITTLKQDATEQEAISVLKRDGCVIIEEFSSLETHRLLNSDLSGIITNKNIGPPQKESDPLFIDFFGSNTLRLDGLPAISPTFVKIICHPFLKAVADHFLLPNCKRYILNLSQIIEIHPGESKQPLHRDQDAWRYFPFPRPQMEIQAIFALSDFTEDNGSTQIVPGSHLWPLNRKPLAQEIVKAIMPERSMLLYLGNTLHGGGTNFSTESKRRGMIISFVLGWLRNEENFFLTVPLEKVLNMPKEAQGLLGYESHNSLGYTHGQNPMEILKKKKRDILQHC